MLPKSGAFTQRKVDSYTTTASTIALESIPSTETVVIPLLGDDDSGGLDPNEPIVHRDNSARRPDSLVMNATANERKTLLREFHRDNVLQPGDDPSTDPVFQGKPTSSPLTYPTAAQLYKKGPPPSIDAQFTVEPRFENVALFLFRDGWLDDVSHKTVSDLDPDYDALGRNIEATRGVDFHPLMEERLDWKEQTDISKDRVKMLTAACFHYGGDLGLVLRLLDKEIGAYRDPERALAAAKPHVSKEDYDAMKRVFYHGCPKSFKYTEEPENKKKYMRKGNHKSIRNNPRTVRKTMNKEERNGHVVPFPRWILKFLCTAHHVPQAMLLKPGKNPRLVWDGTIQYDYWDKPMNEVTLTEGEPKITFGSTKTKHMKRQYNLRVTYKGRDIWLAAPDIKACFRWPKTHPDVAGAFSFFIGFFFFLACAMVFGSSVSAASWEPFRRAIEALAEFYFNDVSLVEKYQSFLDMLIWDEEPPADTVFVQAKGGALNPGVLDKNGKHISCKTHGYVDDVLIAEIAQYMAQALAATLHAIFVVMGEDDDRLRNSNLAMDKWIGMRISHEAVQLGLVFNTRRLTVGITPEYIAEVLKILTTTWHESRKSFAIDEIEQLAGKLGRLGEGVSWIFHLMSQIYTSIASALRSNKLFLTNTSAQFRAMIKTINKKQIPDTEEDVRILNFAVKNVASNVHRCKQKFFMNATLKEEIKFLTAALSDQSIRWETPIGHIIERVPSSEAAADACLYGGGGFSTDLRFWWHLEWPDEIQKRTKLFLANNKCGKLISINALEFVCVIINFVAALVAYDEEFPADDPHPVLLNWCDNTSAIKWCNHACKSSLAGRALGRLFCALLIESKVGINAEYIPTKSNVVSDGISRIKKIKRDSPTSSFDYSTLKQTFPELSRCRAFQPSPKLLSIIWQALLQPKSLNPLSLRKLKPSELGWLGI